MALDATAALGSAALAGVKVNPLGMAARLAGGAGGTPGPGVLGEVISAGVNAALTMRDQRRVAEVTAQPEVVTPKFGRLAYLAASATELALIEVQTYKAVRLRLGTVIASVPRADVASAVLGRGRRMLSPPLTITFTNGTQWALEVPRPSKRHANELVRALGGD